MAPAPAIQTVVLLQALLHGPPDWRFGYELSRLTGLRHGTIYPQLLRLEAAGFLESRWEQHGGRRRHMYRLTGSGREMAAAIMAQSSGRLPPTALNDASMETAAGS